MPIILASILLSARGHQKFSQTASLKYLCYSFEIYTNQGTAEDWALRNHYKHTKFVTELIVNLFLAHNIFIACVTNGSATSSFPSIIHKMAEWGTMSKAFYRFPNAKYICLLQAKNLSCSCFTRNIASLTPLLEIKLANPLPNQFCNTFPRTFHTSV